MADQHNPIQESTNQIELARVESDEAEQTQILRVNRSAGDEESGGYFVPDAKPSTLARQLIDVDHRDPASGAVTLRKHQGDFYEYRGSHYALLDPDVLDSRIRVLLERCVKLSNRRNENAPPLEPIVATQRLVAEARAALVATEDVLIPRDEGPPRWIGDAEGKPNPENILALQNGLFDVTTSTLIPHTPMFFNQIAATYAYDPDAPEPKEWLGMLDSQWADDPESIETLQEMCGNLLTSNTSLQKMYVLIGPKRSSKSMIARIIREMIGDKKAASPTLASLSYGFGLQPLLGASLAVIHDSRDAKPRDQAAALERILSTTGEDHQTIDRKHKDAVTVKLPTRIILISNELPWFRDASGAFVSRCILLRMTRSFIDKEDTGLFEKLLPELPGILNWSLEGLRRLRDRGRFIQPQSAMGLLDDLRAITEPVQRFIQDRCELGSEYEVPVNAVYNEYVLWAAGESLTAMAKTTFGRDIRSAAPTVDVAQRTGPFGRRHRVYTGIRLASGFVRPTPQPDSNAAAHATRDDTVLQQSPEHNIILGNDVSGTPLRSIACSPCTSSTCSLAWRIRIPRPSPNPRWSRGPHHTAPGRGHALRGLSTCQVEQDRTRCRWTRTRCTDHDARLRLATPRWR